jgi:hypothetical protein
MFSTFPIHLRRTVEPGEVSAVVFPLYPDEDVYKGSLVLKFSKKSVRGILPQVCPALFYRMFFLFGIVWGGMESNWVHPALRPPIGLSCQPRVIMMMEKLVEC